METALLSLVKKPQKNTTIKMTINPAGSPGSKKALQETEITANINKSLPAFVTG